MSAKRKKLVEAAGVSGPVISFGKGSDCRVRNALEWLGQCDENCTSLSPKEVEDVAADYVSACASIFDTLEDGIARYSDRIGFQALVMIKRYLDYSLRQCHHYGYRKRKSDMSWGLEKRLSHQSEKDMAKAMRRMKRK